MSGLCKVEMSVFLRAWRSDGRGADERQTRMPNLLVTFAAFLYILQVPHTAQTDSSRTIRLGDLRTTVTAKEPLLRNIYS
jgi:hypothetical protein